MKKSLRLSWSVAALVAAQLTLLAAPMRLPYFCAPHPSPELHPNRAGRLQALSSPNLPSADTLPEPTVIDVMFLYTQQALTGEGDENGIIRRADEAIEETNYRLRISQANVRFNIVHVGRTTYSESGNVEWDVYRLATGTEGLGAVPGQRNHYKADVVVMVVEADRNGYAGIAYQLTPPKGDPTVAFAVMLRSTLEKGNIVLPHELGHLLGCAHDREHAGDMDYYRDRLPYVFGHRFEIEGVTYTDMMSYQPGVTLPYFSNPRMSIDGVRLGVPADEDRPSDGVRTINETAPYIARYRNAQSRVEFVSSLFRVAENEGAAKVRLKRTGDLSAPATLTFTYEAGTAAVGADYQRPPSTQLEFAAGQGEMEIEFPVLPDNITEREETFRIRLSSIAGEHGLGRESAATVAIRDAALPLEHTQVDFPGGNGAVFETDGTAVVKVRFTGTLQPGQTLRIPYLTENGTAGAGIDYEAATGVIVVTNTEAIMEVPIRILDRPEPGVDRQLRLVVGLQTNEVRILDTSRLGATMAIFTNRLENLHAAARRADGKLLVWGDFAKVAGQDRTAIALLNRDFSLDESFRPPVFLLGHRAFEGIGNADVTRVKVQRDGKYLISGGFSRVAGHPRSKLVRLNADGSLDDAFGAGLKFDGNVSGFSVQENGRILVFGQFEKVNDAKRSFIVRLLPDGSVDESFRPNGGPTGWAAYVSSVLVRPDGKIWIGGFFDQVDGINRQNLALLNSDGTLDQTVRPASPSGPIFNMVFQRDGRFLIGGVFDQVAGRTIPKLARLNANGSVDTSFRAPGPNTTPSNIVPLPDGRILVAGPFTTIGQRNRRFVALLASNGTLLSDFDPGRSSDKPLENPISIHADGTILVAGKFKQFNGLPANGLVQLRLGDLPPAVGSAQDGERLGAILHGLVGGQYQIETSTDLSVWKPAGRVRLEGFDQQTRVEIAKEAGQGFVRLKLGEGP